MYVPVLLCSVSQLQDTSVQSSSSNPRLAKLQALPLHLSQSINANCGCPPGPSLPAASTSDLLLPKCHSAPGYRFLAPSLLHKPASPPLVLAFAIHLSDVLRLFYRLSWIQLTTFRWPQAAGATTQPCLASSGRRCGEKWHPQVPL